MPNRVKRIIGFIMLGLAMILVPIVLGHGYYIQILSWVYLNCLMAASMRFIMLTGHVNFAHGGFVGIGAYTSAVLVMKVGMPFWVAFLIAGIASATVALAFGLPTLKLRGAYFFMASFAFAEVIRIIFHYFFTDLFGGINGLVGIPWPEPILGILFNPNSGINYYYLVLVVSVLSLFVFYYLERKTRLGPILESIQQSESLAQSVGIRIMAYKVTGFVIGCFFAGVTGSLYAHMIGVISPFDFTFMLSVYCLIYVVVGGRLYFAGPIIAASVLTFISLFWLKALGFWETVAYGAIMLITILFLPEGMVTLPRMLKTLVHNSEQVSDL